MGVLSALGIRIPGSGPGTGPFIPQPLYSLGVSGYANRFVGERLPAPGNSFTKWDDLASGKTMTPDSGTFTIDEVSGARFLKKTAGAAASATSSASTAYSSPGTFIAAMYNDPANGSGTRTALRAMGFQLSRASNGQYQASAPGGYVTVGTSTDGGWNILALRHPGVAAGAAFPAGAVKLRRGSTSNANTSTTIAPTGQQTIQFNPEATHEVGVAEIVYWPKQLTDDELATVVAAMAAHYPMF